MRPLAPHASLVLFLSLLIFSCPHDAPGYQLYFIDAHSQVDHHIGNLELILQRMNEAGVYCTILAARSGRKPEEVAALAEAHPGEIVPAVRTKSKDYNQNHPRYYKNLHKQVASGRFRAMAEVLVVHAQKGNKAPEVIVSPDDRRVQAALNAAIDHGWPFVIHIEFQALKGEKRQQMMAEMEGLLKAHPDHPFALNHMGQLDATQVRRLIENHPNIHFLTAHANPVIATHSDQPWVNMFDGSTLAPEWRALLLQYPERFVFALDNVWKRHWNDLYTDQMTCWQRAMRDLPHDVAHAVAHGNAERLWKIPPGMKIKGPP